MISPLDKFASKKLEQIDKSASDICNGSEATQPINSTAKENLKTELKERNDRKSRVNEPINHTSAIKKDSNCETIESKSNCCDTTTDDDDALNYCDFESDHQLEQITNCIDSRSILKNKETICKYWTRRMELELNNNNNNSFPDNIKKESFNKNSKQQISSSSTIGIKDNLHLAIMAQTMDADGDTTQMHTKNANFRLGNSRSVRFEIHNGGKKEADQMIVVDENNNNDESCQDTMMKNGKISLKCNNIITNPNEDNNPDDYDDDNLSKEFPGSQIDLSNQPMSLDPSLCHGHQNQHQHQQTAQLEQLEIINSSAKKPSTTTTNGCGNDQTRTTSGSSILEEQSAREDFSNSSANSSLLELGSQSTIATLSDSKQQQQQSVPERSSSVCAMITTSSDGSVMNNNNYQEKNQDNQAKNLDHHIKNMQEQSINLDSESSSQDVCSVTTVLERKPTSSSLSISGGQKASGQNGINGGREIDSNDATTNEEQRNDTIEHEDDSVADDDPENIGVAFESLQFETEIKSSKSEKVSVSVDEPATNRRFAGSVARMASIPSALAALVPASLRSQQQQPTPTNNITQLAKGNVTDDGRQDTAASMVPAKVTPIARARRELINGPKAGGVSSSTVNGSNGQQPQPELEPDVVDEVKNQNNHQEAAAASNSKKIDHNVNESSTENLDDLNTNESSKLSTDNSSSTKDNKQDEDAELLRQRNEKFESAKDVRSVCTLIDAAINDATKQVNRFLNRKQANANCCDEITTSTTTTKSDNSNKPEGELETPSSALERASFVRATRSPPASATKEAAASNPVRLPTGANRVVAVGKLDKQAIMKGLSSSSSSAATEVSTSVRNAQRGNDGETTSDEACQPGVDQMADLAQIFDANVRREIERFELNSLTTSQTNNNANNNNNNKLSNNNNQRPIVGSTEWRIAEEIRLFNERELELKSRLSKTNGKLLHKNNNKCHSIMSINESSSKGGGEEEEFDTVVRNGKTLQISRPTKSRKFNPSSTTTSEQQQQHQIAHATSSIRLSTTSVQQNGQASATSTISMHKFISSAGKRFVYTNQSSSSGGASSNASSSITSSTSSSSSSSRSRTSSRSSAEGAQNNNQLTSGSTTTNGFSGYRGGIKQANNHHSKSMLNLSDSGSKQQQQQQDNQKRHVDFKASDSLANKETPDVEPGKARKVIESFTRLQASFKPPSSVGQETFSVDQTTTNNGKMLGLNNNCWPTASIVEPQTISSNCSRPTIAVGRLSSDHSNSFLARTGCQNNGPISAESKIQDELREMRAREAELRDIRTANANAKPANQQPNEQAKSQNNIDNQQQETINNDDDESLVEERIRPLINGEHSGLDSPSESLYPIKATIDSFRKLNNQSQSNQNQNQNQNQTSHIQSYQQQQRGGRTRLISTTSNSLSNSTSAGLENSDG